MNKALCGFVLDVLDHGKQPPYFFAAQHHRQSPFAFGTRHRLQLVRSSQRVQIQMPEGVVLDDAITA